MIRMTNKTVAASVIMLCALTVSSLWGMEDAALPHIPSTPVRVALFKNGLGYIEREAVLPAGVDAGVLNAMPSPVHGTFWVTPETEGVSLRRIVAGWTQPDDSTGYERDVRDIVELLEANSGREVELVIVNPKGIPEEVRGRIRLLDGGSFRLGMPSGSESGFLSSVGMAPGGETGRLDHASALLLARRPMITNREMWMQYESLHAPTANTRSSHPQPSTRLLLIETEKGQLVLDSSAVRHVGGRNLRVRVREHAIPQPRVTVDVTGNEAGATLNVAYLAQGITWAPSYRVQMLDDTTLRLHAKAQIINDLEDLNDVRCSFIAGFPNVKFSHVTDPLAFRGDMPSWLRSLSPPTHHGAFDRGRQQNVMTQQVVMSNQFMPDEVDMQAGFDPMAFADRGDADLFYYDVEHVTLKRGERGYVPMFTTDVPYESVYTCRVTQAQPPQGERGEESPEDVWHALRISNTSEQPWTTAPATVTKDGQFLGQDTLYFTSLGSRTLLRFAKALDVRVRATEREIGRETNVRHRDNRNWDLVTAEGTIRVSNLKSVPVAILIQRTVEGEIVENPHDATQTLSASGITQINPTSDLSWEVTLQPRQTQTLSYTYKRFVR